MKEKISACSSPGLPKLGYTRHQAAQILGISVESLDRLVARGLINPSRALRRPIFTVATLAHFLEETKGA